jgi:hypothetical protein
VLWSGAPDSDRCTRPIQGWTSHSRKNAGALRYNSPDCPVCHRTIWCASGATAKSRNGRLWQELQCRTEVRTTKSEGHRTVRCRKRTKPQRSTRLRTLTVGWRGGALDSAHYLSGGTPDCPVRPSPAASQRLPWWLRAITTPNHHNSKHPRFLSITVNTRALAFTPRHNSKDQSLSKSQIHLKHLVTCERNILCSFELLLIGLPFFFSFLLSSVL